MKRRILHVLVVTFCSIHFAFAQDRETYQKKQFTTDGNTLNYRILYPESFNQNKQYPVVLFLHGAGERGNDNEKQLTHGSELFLAEGFRKEHPAVIIFPQCPENDYWAQVEVERNELPFRFKYNYSKEPTVPMRLVMELMDSIRALPYVNNSRLYVGGLSMGGMGTFEILYRSPEMFAAAFPICGGGDPSSATVYADDVSLWVFHGAQDNVVLPSYSTDMVIALIKAGADVQYTLYKDANHNSWDQAFAEPGLFRWLFSKEKQK